MDDVLQITPGQEWINLMRRVARLLGLVSAALMALGAVTPAAADSTAETTVSVTTQDAGSFTIEFAQLAGGYVFTGVEGGALTVSAIEGNIATATIRISWTDSRALGNRTGYAIALGASDLMPTGTVPSGANATIPVSNLSIITVGATQLTPALTLDQARTIFNSDANPQNNGGSVDLELQLVIPPSIYPTTYSSTLHVELLPTSP